MEIHITKSSNIILFCKLCSRRRNHCGLRSGESFPEEVGLTLAHKESIDYDLLGVGKAFQTERTMSRGFMDRNRFLGRV